MYFDYDHLEFRYEPFPIGCARPLMAPEVYREFLEGYPPLELFANIPKLGNKYSLSERFNPRQYRDLIQSKPPWREFHAWIKSRAFIDGVMAALKARHLDLGYADARKGLGKLAGDLVPWLDGGRLSARFEFSMLPAEGGHILPHSDAPSKIVTLIVSMVGEGEWDDSFGGGTDINRPKRAELSYNWMNKQASFDDMEVVDTYEFLPNQAVVFVKTHNSWHSVRPMTGGPGSPMRRTLTINIEKA